MKKKIPILVFIIFLKIISVQAQEIENTVSLTVSGGGKTKEEAKQAALRSAIEQTYGAFISSKTEILNDSLVKDEIVSIVNGNIQKFETISEVQLQDGNYATVLNVTVSISKLTSFVKSNGGQVDFKGSLFASNMMIYKFNEENEISAIRDLTTILKNISDNSFDYKISANNPVFNNGIYSIPINIDVFTNSNFQTGQLMLEKSLKSLSLSASEIENYTELRKPIFPITLATTNSNRIYYLRNFKSVYYIIDYILNFTNSISNFLVKNDIEEFSIQKYNFLFHSENNNNFKFSGPQDFRRNSDFNLKIYDCNFRLYLLNNYGDVEAPSLFGASSSLRQLESSPLVLSFLKLNLEYLDKPFQDGKFEINNFNNGNNGSHIYQIFKQYYIDPSGCEKFRAFLPLKKLMTTKNEQNFGFVVSFGSISPNSQVVQFKFDDLRSIDEIKNITKYEIIKQATLMDSRKVGVGNNVDYISSYKLVENEYAKKIIIAEKSGQLVLFSDSNTSEGVVLKAGTAKDTFSATIQGYDADVIFSRAAGKVTSIKLSVAGGQVVLTGDRE